MEAILLTAAFVWSAVGAVYDVAAHRIPNKVSYSGILFGLLLRFSVFGWRGLGAAAVGGLIGGGIFFLLYLLRAMGAGDVKLMAAVGCMAGPTRILPIITVCALAGGLMAVVVMIYKKRAFRTIRNVVELLRFRLVHGAQVHPSLNIDNPESVRLPYAVAIAAGALYPLLNVVFLR